MQKGVKVCKKMLSKDEVEHVRIMAKKCVTDLVGNVQKKWLNTK
jgi:hypothetical protein